MGDSDEWLVGACVGLFRPRCRGRDVCCEGSKAAWLRRCCSWQLNWRFVVYRRRKRCYVGHWESTLKKEIPVTSGHWATTSRGVVELGQWSC